MPHSGSWKSNNQKKKMLVSTLAILHSSNIITISEASHWVSLVCKSMLYQKKKLLYFVLYFLFFPLRASPYRCIFRQWTVPVGLDLNLTKIEPNCTYISREVASIPFFFVYFLSESYFFILIWTKLWLFHLGFFSCFWKSVLREDINIV